MMIEKTEEVHSYVGGSSCPGTTCLLKGLLQASKTDTNTESHCLSLQQVTCLLNNSLAVEWDIISFLMFGPTCHPIYCLDSCTHLMDSPEPPCTGTGCAWLYHNSDKKFSHVSSGLLLAGLHIFDAEDSTSVVSDPSGADLLYGSALCGLDKEVSVACRGFGLA